MSDITEENIADLAKLCRLELSSDELTHLHADLKKILTHVEQLQSIDVSDLSPYSHLEEQSLSAQRKDDVSEVLSRDTFLANSPDSISGMIRVPTVIRNASKER